MSDVILQDKGTFEGLLDDVECNIGEWEFEFIIRERNGDFSLQIQFDAIDNVGFEMIDGMRAEITGIRRQFCRLWPLQNTMTDSEVIRTAWKAVEAAVKHEVEERFRFQGEMIFCPHTNVHALVAMRKKENIDDVRIAQDDSAPELTLAIRYAHFVEINYLDEDVAQDILDWIAQEAVVSDTMTGSIYGVRELKFDNGGWRDRVLHPVKGIEFRYLADAVNFVEKFGGVYNMRRIENV